MPTNDEPILPVYEPQTRSLTLSTSSTRGLANGLPSQFASLGSTLHYPLSFLQMEHHETFTYTYNLFANDTRLHIFILVESEPDRPGHYTFTLSMKIGHVERALSKPVTMRLSIDPRQLDFVVFVFPPRPCLPSGCLYHLRVWLRTGGVDHRMFAEKDLWFGKDPDFRAIGDASFAYLRNATHDMSIYQGLVGRAHVSFILRWTLVEPGIYALSLDYEAGGAGRILFADYRLRLYCEPQAVSFLIYTIPVPSTPAGATHRLRVWLRTPQSRPLPTEPSSKSSSSHASPPESYVYQRLWKLDDLKIGAHLAFDAVGDRIVLATPGPGPSDYYGHHGQGQDARTPTAARATVPPPAATIAAAGAALSPEPSRRRPLPRLVAPPVGTAHDTGESASDC